MGLQIQAILFDMGGTLRRSAPQSIEVRDLKIQEILKFLGSSKSPTEMYQTLLERGHAYHKWASESFRELTDREIWTRWMLPEWPAEMIIRNTVYLNRLWRDANVRRHPLPETKMVIEELFHRGYRIGLVSNTTSSTEAPDLLKSLNIYGLYETIILSCNFGRRKGDPAILLEASNRMGLSPGHCAYVGDRPHKDVAAARKAGFAKAVLLVDPERPERSQPADPSLAPDHFINNLTELFNIFPSLQAEPGKPGDKHQPVWDVSLSTMWAISNFPSLNDFGEAARRMGIAGIELNHQVDSSMLDGTNIQERHVSSIHEPCPANISVDELKNRDWLVSALDNENRRQGVESVKRSIDLAYSLGVKTIVFHAGQVSPDLSLENRLRRLYTSGKSKSDEFLALQDAMKKERAAVATAHLEAVQKSLQELLEYALPFGIRLGIENRDHYPNIPTPDETELLLSMAGPDQLGFWYDVGHAQVMDRLGFFPHQEWLDRFASRMTGVHLHDVIGLEDHRAPGTGEVDFDHIARYLPASSIRTLELKPDVTPEEVRNSLLCLTEKDCIRHV